MPENLIELIKRDGRVKAVACHCGAGYVMQAAMPMAETEAPIIKEFAKYARQGRRIEMLQAADRPPFCNCKSAAQGLARQPIRAVPPSLDPCQLSLFAA